MEYYVTFLFRVVSDMVHGHSIILNLKRRIKWYNIYYNFNFKKQRNIEKGFRKNWRKYIHLLIDFSFLFSKVSYIIIYDCYNQKKYIVKLKDICLLTDNTFDI